MVSPVKVGITTVALVLRKPTSRIFATVPPKVMAVPPKLLACVFNVMSETAVVTATVVAPPVAVIAPDCVIEPPDVNDKVPPTLVVPTSSAVVSVTLTALAPLFARDTEPENVLAPLNVITPAEPPAVKLALPPMDNAPDCVIAPVPPVVVTENVEPTVEAPNTVAMVFVKLAVPAPLLVKDTAPVNTLACVAVIELAPALKLVVPGTVNAPDCVIAPPAIALKLPLLVRVIAGNAMAAVSNCKDKLRKLLKPAKLGNVAPLLALRKPTSRIFATVPPKARVLVPKMLALVFSRISEAAAVTMAVMLPPVVMMPLCEIEPPEVSDKVLPTVEAAIFNAAVSTTLTALAPLFASDTAPVNTLF